MADANHPDIATRIAELYRDAGRRVFATLIRLLGDFDRAEEAMQDAFHTALTRWPDEGMPHNPVAWLISTGRFQAIDALRRDKRTQPFDEDLASPHAAAAAIADDELADDRLRLVFTCCHPGLAEEARVALTLREVCGLTTEEIARAFVLPAPTLAQRIVRAKAKIRDARIPFEAPSAAEFAQRLGSVLRVVYLVFNEGYSASAGAQLQRHELADESIRLARLLCELMPEPEVLGLLALLLLQHARHRARSDQHGDLVPLDEQDRSAWDRELIREGCALAERALATRRIGPYCVQAAIAAVHGEATDATTTDWPQIVGLYDVLCQLEPTPVVELNRAVAIAMRDGAGVGLALVDELLVAGRLDHYHLAHAARADLCRRLGRRQEARDAYRRALQLAQQEPERRFLAGRLAALDTEPG